MIYLRPQNKEYLLDNINYNSIINDKFTQILINNIYTIYDISDNIKLYDIDKKNNNDIDEDIIIDNDIDKIMNIRYMYIIDEKIIGKIKMLLYDNKIKKKDNKHLVTNNFIFLDPIKNNNKIIDQYIKITNDNFDIHLTLIKHNNFIDFIDETKLNIDDDKIAINIFKSLGYKNITYFEYYITIYKYNKIIIELYTLPGIDHMIIIYGNKYHCDDFLKLLDLDNNKSLNGDIRNIYLMIDIDPYKISNFSFDNIEIIKKISQLIKNKFL